MKINKFFYIILLFILFTFIGCSAPHTLNQHKFSESESNDDIIIKTGSIPNNLTVIGVRDDNNFFCLYGPTYKKLYLYNVETGKRTLFRSPISRKSIRTANINDKWLVWIEDEGKIESDSGSELNWIIYAENLETSKIIEIDRYKSIQLKPAVYMALQPKELSLYDDKVVYDNYDVLEEGTIAAVIKMYNLTNNKMQILAYNKEYQDSFFSHPKIYQNFIVWSLSKCDLDDYSELGDTYIYNIDTKEKTLISKGTETLWPNIYSNYIAARVKPNGQNDNSSIVLYDLNGTRKWETVVSPQSDAYKNETHVELLMPIISEYYLIWQDNIRSKMLVYNCTDKKIYKLDEKVSLDGSIMPIGIYNKVLFWVASTSGENNRESAISTIKYAILK